MKRKTLLGLTIGLFSLSLLAYFFLPLHHVSAEKYFLPAGERTLQKDEIGQFNYIFEHYEHLSFTGDEFKGWDTEMLPYGAN